MNTNPRILLVEDNPTTSKTLVLFLSSENYETTCAFNGKDGIKLFRAGRFDLVLLDLMLPDLDGMKVCQAIREQAETPIVILSARSTEGDIVEGLETGADDYVCKPFGARELLARVRRCLRPRGRPLASPEKFQNGGIILDTKRREVSVDGQLVSLTKSEFDILAVLIRNPGRVLTRDQLIDKALGPHFEGFDRTIDTHIWSLRKKIGEPRGNPQYILSEPGVGYRMSDHHET